MTRIGLSVDGGGLRGVIPTVVLRELALAVGGDLREHIDIMAGTSAGSLVTAGLRMGLSPGDMVGMWDTFGKMVFRNPRGKIGQLFKARYDRAYAESALQSVFGAKRPFSVKSEATLPLLVTSYDVRGKGAQGAPFIFKSWRDDHKDFLLWQVVLASSIVPTAHGALMMTDPETGMQMCMIDGGIFAQNPSSCLLAEMRRLWPDDEHVIISLGTGQEDKRASCRAFRKGGLLGIAKNIIPVMLDSGLDAEDYKLSRDPLVRYIRVQVALPPGLSASDPSVENMRELRKMGQLLSLTSPFKAAKQALLEKTT